MGGQALAASQRWLARPGAPCGRAAQESKQARAIPLPPLAAFQDGLQRQAHLQGAGRWRLTLRREARALGGKAGAQAGPWWGCCWVGWSATLVAARQSLGAAQASRALLGEPRRCTVGVATS